MWLAAESGRVFASEGDGGDSSGRPSLNSPICPVLWSALRGGSEVEMSPPAGEKDEEHAHA